MKIYVIIGQTATGKTAKALEIAKKVNGELVNFDSRQVYKKLDIVTGKDIDTSSFHEVEKRKDFDIGFFKINQPTTDYRPSSGSMTLPIQKQSFPRMTLPNAQYFR